MDREQHAKVVPRRRSFHFWKAEYHECPLAETRADPMLAGMNVAVIGPGRIGSTFALYLARAGHDVTVVARGARLEALRREPAIVAVDGTRAPVRPVEALDLAEPFDLVLVAVLAHQVDAVLPTLERCAAKTIMFMFNTFEPIDRLRDAVGPERFAFGFPNMIAFFVEGKLKSIVDGPGMVTTLSSERWAATLEAAGMPTEVEHDMTSFLRSHVAFVVPLMAAAMLTWQRPTKVTWAEASKLAAAWVEGLALVRSLGHTLTPRFVVLLAKLPRGLLAGMLWIAGRIDAVTSLGGFGPAEVRALIDAMAAAAPGQTPHLLAIRP
ncbi:ketopantoate reductase family protein [Nannocystaceae bacterium ST9]